MNKIKRVSLFLVLIVLLTSLQGCSVPVNHYSQNYLHSGFCYYATVEYDTHVDYGEVISFNICIGQTLWKGGDFLIDTNCFAEDDATIYIKDSDYYEIVGQSAYVLNDFSEKKYLVDSEDYKKKDAYLLSLDFSIKITEPTYDLETLYVDIDYFIEEYQENEFGEVEYFDVSKSLQFPVLKYLSDDDGVTVYYYTRTFGYRKFQSI